MKLCNLPASKTSFFTESFIWMFQIWMLSIKAWTLPQKRTISSLEQYPETVSKHREWLLVLNRRTVVSKLRHTTSGSTACVAASSQTNLVKASTHGMKQRSYYEVATFFMALICAEPLTWWIDTSMADEYNIRGYLREGFVHRWWNHVGCDIGRDISACVSINGRAMIDPPQVHQTLMSTQTNMKMKTSLELPTWRTTSKVTVR